MPIFGSDLRVSNVRTTVYGVDLTQEELDRFRAVNSDTALIRDLSESVARTNLELSDLPPEERLAIKIKRDYLNKLIAYLRSGTNVAQTAAILVFGETESYVNVVLDVIKQHKSDISLELMRVFEPDFQLPSNEVPPPKKVVCSQVQRTGIAPILKKLTIPESIATDVDKIYREGLDITSMGSLATSLIARYMNIKEEEKTDTTGFDFSHEACGPV
jgi:hypothetical protein